MTQRPPPMLFSGPRPSRPVPADTPRGPAGPAARDRLPPIAPQEDLWRLDRPSPAEFLRDLGCGLRIGGPVLYISAALQLGFIAWLIFG
ncbi:hypothetical protein [Frigidibacter oleivorans]|uniref:hypothetical protein n=1 Tax=Frigidibacter oleivorans TaxID=2487129 RepID=UPI000F8C8E8A|nr:hypothetical protein [Frigidibacter oleivorans]